LRVAGPISYQPRPCASFHPDPPAHPPPPSSRPAKCTGPAKSSSCLLLSNLDSGGTKVYEPYIQAPLSPTCTRSSCSSPEGTRITYINRESIPRASTTGIPSRGEGHTLETQRVRVESTDHRGKRALTRTRKGPHLYSAQAGACPAKSSSSFFFDYSRASS